MVALVPIPWQPHLYLTPHTLSYLKAASRRVGHNLYLYDNDYKRVSPAWRSFSQQLTAWTKYLAGRGPIASSPYTGQRNHMRGAAFDLREQSATVQAACRYVGLVRDTAEPWHWNDPLWRSMPIIKTRTAPSVVTVSLITQSQEPSMNAVRSKTKPENYYLFDSVHGWRSCTQAEAGAINALLGRKKAPVLTPDDIHLLQAIYGPWKA